jgi:hypothetical protein
LKCFEIGSLILGCFGRFGFDGVVNDLEKEKKLNFFFWNFAIHSWCICSFRSVINEITFQQYFVRFVLFGT